MTDDADIRDAAATLVSALSKARRSVATAESCTGGWIAKAITDIPGSSAVIGYGIVSYSNGAKASMLGVRNKTLEENGAVSEPVVIEMAEGAVRLSGADVGVAVSGVAGPDGGTTDKPVGTVWFAWTIRDDDLRTETEQMRFSGDRNAVRRQTVLHALTGIQSRLDT